MRFAQVVCPRHIAEALTAYYPDDHTTILWKDSDDDLVYFSVWQEL